MASTQEAEGLDRCMTGEHEIRKFSLNVGVKKIIETIHKRTVASTKMEYY